MFLGQADLLQSIQGFRRGGGLKHIDAQDLEKPTVSTRSQAVVFTKWFQILAKNFKIFSIQPHIEMIMALQGDQKSNLRHVSVSGFEKEKRHYSEEDELFQDSF